MRAVFKDLPEAYRNTLAVAERCDRRPHVRPVPPAASTRCPTASRSTPTWSTWPSKGSDRALRLDRPPTRWSSASATSSASSCQDGLLRLFPRGVGLHRATPGARASRSGPGRGSSAGSLVAYCLGITNVDPIRLRAALRALSQPRADLDAGHGHRLRRRPARRGHPLRRRPLRRRPGRPHHHVRDHGGQGGASATWRASSASPTARPTASPSSCPAFPLNISLDEALEKAPRARRAGQARSAGGRAVGGGPRPRGLHPARLRPRLRGGHLRRAAHGARAALQGPQAARADHRASPWAPSRSSACSRWTSSACRPSP